MSPADASVQRELRLVVGSQLEVVQTQVYRSEDEVLTTGNRGSRVSREGLGVTVCQLRGLHAPRVQSNWEHLRLYNGPRSGQLRFYMAKKLCFVIMPFAEKFAGYYRTIYVPAIGAAGLRSKKADTDAGPETLLDSICRDIVSADVVLAELTGKKLNVSYEVGYAHARGKPVILIAQSMRAVPSDIQHIRVVRYKEGKRAWRKNLRDQIANAIKAVMANPDRFRPREIGAIRPGMKAGRKVRRGPRRITPDKVGGRGENPRTATLTKAVQVVTQQLGLAATALQRSGTRGFLHVNRAVPSQVKQLAALLKDHFGVQLQWKRQGEECELWWDAGGAPDVSKVAEFAEMLGMIVSVEGLSA